MSPLVASWRRGEGTQAQIASRAGLATSTFSWWCGKLAEPSPGSSRFVAVDVEPEAVDRARPFEVLLPGGRCVRVPPAFDDGALTRLLRILERPC